MNSDDKLLAILVTGIFVGAVGSTIVGWPALVCAAIAIASIAMSRGKA